MNTNDTPPAGHPVPVFITAAPAPGAAVPAWPRPVRASAIASVQEAVGLAEVGLTLADREPGNLLFSSSGAYCLSVEDAEALLEQLRVAVAVARRVVGPTAGGGGSFSPKETVIIERGEYCPGCAEHFDVEEEDGIDWRVSCVRCGDTGEEDGGPCEDCTDRRARGRMP